jgi:hypothetical protein
VTYGRYNRLIIVALLSERRFGRKLKRSNNSQFTPNIRVIVLYLSTFGSG